MAPVRDARPEDAARLAEIHAVTWRAAYRGLLDDAFLNGLTPDTRLEWWVARLTRVPPRWAVLVAEDGKAVTGFVTIGQCGDDDRLAPGCGELFAMYVDPGCWGHGHGRELLLVAEERFRAFAYRDATLWVLRENRRARRFYEIGGWEPDGNRKRMIIGSQGVIAVRYRRTFDEKSFAAGCVTKNESRRTSSHDIF